MKKLIWLLCGMMALDLTLAEPLTIEEKQQFVQYYKTWSKFLEEFPDHPEVKVLFFDIDHDGTEEAVAADYGQKYEDGTIWILFQRENKMWKPIKKRMTSETSVDPISSVFARGGEFYSMVSKGAYPDFAVSPPILCAICKNYDKQAPNGQAPPNSYKVTIDQEGFIKTEKLPALDDFIAYSENFSKLERLKVESFTVTK